MNFLVYIFNATHFICVLLNFCGFFLLSTSWECVFLTAIVILQAATNYTLIKLLWQLTGSDVRS